ncbi:MAG: hypothetical protein ACOYJZ_01745 [Acutalibacter sp.]
MMGCSAAWSCPGSEEAGSALERISSLAGERVAQGVALLREGKLGWTPGYDGVFGSLELPWE